MHLTSIATLIVSFATGVMDDGPAKASSESTHQGKPAVWTHSQVTNASCTSCHVPSRDDAFRNFQVSHSWIDVTRPAGAEGLGADLIPVDDSLRVQLKLPEGQGLVVSGVAPQSHADQCGLKTNDILLTLADKPLATAEDLTLHLTSAIRQPTRPDSPTVLHLSLMRAGKRINLQVQPDVRVALAPVVQEKPEFYLGVPANPVDETLRAHLNIPQGTGLILGEVTKDTPAAKAGLQHNDILLSFDSKPVPEVESLRSAIQGTQGKEAKLQILRAGQPMDLTATPELRKEASQAKSLFPGVHNLEQLYRMHGQSKAEWLVTPRLDGGVKYYFSDANKLPHGALFASNHEAGTPELTKKIDELNAKLGELTRAVEALSKARPQESR